MRKYFFLMTVAIMMLGFTACSDNDDTPTTNPTDPKALVGTWVGDLTGKTFSIWSYGKAWNVWMFNADGTGVCDTYFLAGEEPVAVQHQPTSGASGNCCRCPAFRHAIPSSSMATAAARWMTSLRKASGSRSGPI